MEKRRTTIGAFWLSDEIILLTSTNIILLKYSGQQICGKEMGYYFLDDTLSFPSLYKASSEGIVAIGGDLSEERLLLAYRSGIFPWFSEEDPIIWWSPDPRFVLYPSEIKVSKSMQQLLKKQAFRITVDTNFEAVIRACQQARRVGQNGTWITPEMLKSYVLLHQKGYAHSVEVWQGERLIGGLYGLSLGKCFFGESMFAKVSNASKYGFISLVKLLQEKQFEIIDCQSYTQHLESLGAVHIPRATFKKQLDQALQNDEGPSSWSSWL